jgi:dTDP-4-dehydrorhamnose reductase
MKILILGGTGFIGFYLYNQLNNIHEVDFTSTSNEAGIRYKIEKNSLKNIISENYDIIINNINPRQISYSHMVRGIEEVVSVCKETNTWLIQVSSILAQHKNRNLNSYNLKKTICDDIIIQELPKEKYTILRFPQLFDNIGLARESQPGLYYLLESIKKNEPIALFSNYEVCLRNYLPVELLLHIIDLVIKQHKKGMFNAYLNSFSFKFPELINSLIKLNPEYESGKLISVGNNKGFCYHIEPHSEDLVKDLKYQTPYYYFEKAYSQLNERNF